jgi:hypothetical protein
MAESSVNYATAMDSRLKKNKSRIGSNGRSFNITAKRDSVPTPS